MAVADGPRWPPRPSRLEEQRLLEAAASGIWTDGPWTRIVEQKMCRVTGAVHAVAFNSCTSAIHAALIALGAGPGVPVSAPAFSFTGSITGAMALGAKLTFRDIDPVTLNAPGPYPGTDGITIHVDLHGVPHQGIRSLFRPVLTDSCQALGSAIGPNHIGGAGTHAWSFSSAKLVTAPDGGAITTSDPAIAAALRELRNYGIPAGQERGTGVATRPGGHNWRPSELSMVMVATRLDLLDEYVARTRLAATVLHQALDAAGLMYQQAPAGTDPAWHKIRFWPASLDQAAASEIARRLTEAGVPVHRWCDVPLHQHPVSATGQSLPVAETMARGSLCLGTEHNPPHTWTGAELGYVCDILTSELGDLS